MPELIEFKIEDRVATITMNDGKANIMSERMLLALAGAFKRARSAQAAVILKSGLEKTFSAGFDIKLLASSQIESSRRMIQLGAALILDVMSHPHPVISVCAGHAYPMGAFLLLASDIRVGVHGEYCIGLNEVAIGIAVPDFALALCESRLSASHLYRTAVLGQMLRPSEALEAGFLDVLIPTDVVEEEMSAIVKQMQAIDHQAHTSTKMRLRSKATAVVKKTAVGEFAIPLDLAANS